VDEQELGQAILSLLEVGQMSAARQLQQKLAPTHVPIELLLVETALVIAEISTSTVLGRLTPSVIPTIVAEHLQSLSLVDDITSASPLEV
jgi:spatacsin